MADTTAPRGSVTPSLPPEIRNGAPTTEIEITPEMIEAGAEVIWRCFDETIPHGSSFGEHVAVLVFRAMNGLPEPG